MTIGFSFKTTKVYTSTSSQFLPMLLVSGSSGVIIFFYNFSSCLIQCWSYWM